MERNSSLGYKRYAECLNDLMDYFILADIELLTQFQQTHDLSYDLLTEFTTTDSGDTAVRDGVILPLAGIENHPYTVYFTLDAASVFDSEIKQSDLQRHQSGYLVQVISQRLYLFTMPILRRWPNFMTVVTAHKPFIDVDNGWYQVTVRAGETLQESGWEPTIEFHLCPQDTKPELLADTSYRFQITRA
uniref:hypothetical protein n=1 Tax=Thaumasiovibrio occultus TaxID=1891184 RepID=UPI00131D3837|nr:hypothetical protein [Thaumasiovibrio occultus]